MSSAPNNIQLISSLETALSDFERGIADKSGTTDLVALLSSMDKSPELIFEVVTYLKGHLAKEPASEVQFWQAITLVCDWVSRPNANLSRSIELSLFKLNDPKSIKYALQSLRHLEAKISPSTFKELNSSNWPVQTILRLAISGYSGDEFGLGAELVNIYNNHPQSTAFTAFKGTYFLLVEAVSEAGLYKFIHSLSANLANRSLANDILKYVDGLEGTQLVRGGREQRIRQVGGNYINPIRLQKLGTRSRSIKRTHSLAAVGG